MPPTLLITGGTGFLGKRLAIALRGSYETVLTGRNNKQNMIAQEFAGCRVLPMDVANIESVRERALARELTALNRYQRTIGARPPPYAVRERVTICRSGTVSSAAPPRIHTPTEAQRERAPAVGACVRADRLKERARPPPRRCWDASR